MDKEVHAAQAAGESAQAQASEEPQMLVEIQGTEESMWIDPSKVVAIAPSAQDTILIFLRGINKPIEILSAYSKNASKIAELLNPKEH